MTAGIYTAVIYHSALQTAGGCKVLPFAVVSFDCYVLLCVLWPEYNYRVIPEILGGLTRGCNITSIALSIPHYMFRLILLGLTGVFSINPIAIKNMPIDS